MQHRCSTTNALMLAGLLACGVVNAGGSKDHGMSDSSEVRDAWIDGKIETVYMLNTHLNGFAIDTRVNNGTVTLSGEVANDIDRDLAGELAMTVEGVQTVDNQLSVVAEESLRKKVEDSAENFAANVQDATITANVKTQLLASEHIEAFEIDVDTKDNVVTLKGHVTSDQASELAESIAANAASVKAVNNQLEIRRKS